MRPSLSMPLILATLAVGLATVDSLGQAHSPRSGARSLFERLDENNDGMLSAGEFATSRLGRARSDMFQRLDSDGDGQLSRREFAAIRNDRPRDRDDASRRALDEPSVAIGSVEQVDRYRDASAYSHAHAGLALLIMRDGEIVFEQYAEGFTRNSAFQIASSTKSFWGPLAAIAVDEGLFDFDDRVSDVLTEWKDDPRKSRITVRHLLSFSSGLEAPRRLWADSNTDKVALAIMQPAVHEPGAVFAYSEIHLYAFRAYLERRLQASEQHREFDTAYSYLKARILDPLGIKITRWRTEADGAPAMGVGAVMTAGHFAKFGELLRRRGMWGDERLVSEAALSEVFTSSPANQAYGLTWWLNEPSEDSSRPADRAGSRGRRSTDLVSEDGIVPGSVDDLVMAAGAGQQRLYVVPSEHLVIVRFANADMPRATMTGQNHLMDLTFEDDEFFLRLQAGEEANASSDPTGPARTAIINEQYLPSADEMMSWIRTIMAKGARRAGAPADLRFERWAVETLQSWGIADVRVQRLPVPYWKTGESSIKVGKETVACFPMAAGDWRGVVRGELHVYSDMTDPASLKDKIVLLDYPLAMTRPGLSARRAIYVHDPDDDLMETSHANPLTQKSPAASTVDDILTASPAAVICILENYFDSHMIFGRHTNGRAKTTIRTPIAWGSSREVAKLKALIAEGVREAEVRIDCGSEESESSNIIAFLPGTGDDYVIVGSHRDQAFAQAVQDTTGIAVVLAQARYWSRVAPEQRPHNFIFLLSAGHFLGTKGVQAFLHEYKELIDKTVLEMHAEHVGLEGKIEGGRLVVLDRPEPRMLFVPSIDIVERTIREAVVAEDMRRTIIGGPPPRGDSWPFHVVGIPTVQFVSVPVYLMDEQDTLDKVDQKGLVQLSKVFIRLIEATRGMSAADIRARTRDSGDPLNRRAGRFDRNRDGVLQIEERLRLMDYVGLTSESE